MSKDFKGFDPVRFIKTVFMSILEDIESMNTASEDADEFLKTEREKSGFGKRFERVRETIHRK